MLGHSESHTLADRERQVLLALVMDSIAAKLFAGEMPAPPDDSPILQQHRSVFVTLREPSGDLRGCMGDMSASRPLGKAVQRAALSAAFRDPRFRPLSGSELAGMAVEISVLSPMRRIQGIREIEVGKHGLVIRARGQAGLLLPQVASSRGWSREQFLAAICRKARLPEDAWKQKGAALHVFTAEIFGGFTK